ncbi:MAG: protein kinase [Pirellulaceae bacterium]
MLQPESSPELGSKVAERCFGQKGQTLEHDLAYNSRTSSAEIGLALVPKLCWHSFTLNLTAAMIDDDDAFQLDEDEGSDTDVRIQGDRDTHASDADQSPTKMPFKSGQLCGEFQLEKLLGRGSSGCVFRALDTVSRRSCALKILTRSNERDHRRDRIGFRKMMGVRHPNLLRVDQLHRLDGYVALSMEEIHGETLGKARRRFRKMETQIALNKLLSLTRDYASGLAAMHSNGLLHRDIKPSNLMVNRSDVGKVIDYGLVGTFDMELDTKCYRDYIAGTIRYISPEAYFEQLYTPAGDIFSLGLVILEMLSAITGRSEWTRDEKNKSQDALLISSAVDELNESIPEVLREGCLEMLQIGAGDRPTAAQVARLGLPLGTSTIYMGGQPLFGRESEFAMIGDWLAEIYSGGQGRFHLHGESGIGKTGLVDAIERHLRSLRWGQVFRARCRPRDSQPMQAIDQFCDQIASRYSRNDRNPLLVDPVSAEILHQAFPVLKDVVKKSMKLPMKPSGQDRVDALAAAINLSVQLRDMGPLIFIVDDVQWADVDSSAVLDELQAVGGPMLGIITISRRKETSQTQAPNHILKLKPLRHEIGVRMLREAAQRWSVSCSDSEILELADVAAGNPFRLGELSDEFRPGGLLHEKNSSSNSSIDRLGNLDRLCQKRVLRLSDEARRLLPLIATADSDVSINQLELLTGMGELIEIAVSELVNFRLIMDDATGGCCIKMIHDRVCDGVIAKLGPAECRAANAAWADLLRSDLASVAIEPQASSAPLIDPNDSQDPPRQAGRIARHLLDAGNTKDALAFAKQAAIESEQAFAFREAGEWHSKVAAIEGDQRFYHLTEAARLFVKGDMPAKAADCFMALATLTADNEPISQQFQADATRLLIRSGRFNQSRATLNQLAAQMHLPKFDASLPWLSIATRCLRIVRGELFPVHLLRPTPSPKSPPSPDAVAKIDFAQSLIRPLLFFNGPYAGELFLHVAKRARQFGDESQNITSAIASATFACSDSGARRNRGEHLLREIQSSAIDAGPRIAGEFWAAKSLASVFSLDWQLVDESVKAASNAYRRGETSARYEESQVHWLNLWAKWYLGDWEAKVSLRDTLIDDAQRRDDRLSHFLASSGLASAAWLIDDDIASLEAANKLNSENFADAGQISGLMQFLTTVQMQLYCAQYEQAHQSWLSFDHQLAKTPLSRVQLARIISSQFGALTSLHQFRRTGETDWMDTAFRSINKLRSERLPCAIATAALYSGICNSLSGDQSASRKHLVAAQQLAKEQKLLPVELSAKDHLHFLESGDWRGILAHKMQSSSVKEPENFERIYTVPLTE